MRERGGFLEQEGIQRLFRQLDVIREQWVQVDGLYQRDPHAVTARRVDEAGTAGQRVYTAAGSLIGAALDNMDALRVLLRPGDGVGPWAPYNLIRGAFLPAIWAIWILEPPESVDRRIRGLRFAIVNQKEWDKFWSAFPASREEVERRSEFSVKVKKTYHDEADRLGIEWAAAGNAINLVDEIPKMTTLRDVVGDQIETVVGLWRGMSGIAHGYSYAVQAYSDIRINHKTATGASVTTFLNDERLHGNALIAGSATISAMILYRDRSTDPVRPA